MDIDAMDLGLPKSLHPDDDVVVKDENDDVVMHHHHHHDQMLLDGSGSAGDLLVGSGIGGIGGGLGDDSDDEPLVNLAAAKSKSLAVKKSAVKEESDDDDDMPLSSLASKAKPSAAASAVASAAKKIGAAAAGAKRSAAAAAGAAIKKAVKKEDNDDDFDDDDDKPLKRKPAGGAAAAGGAKKGAAAAAAAKKKVKKEESDDESESDSSDDDDDFSSDDSDDGKKRKTSSAKKKAPAKPKASPAAASKAKAAADADAKKRVKPEKKSVKEEEDVKPAKKKKKEEPTIYQWWLHDTPLKDGEKWRFLEHNGVTFPPRYVKNPANTARLIYKGRRVDLPAAAEEVAYMYAGMLKSDYISKPRFRENFWRDWKKKLGPDSEVTDLDQCDFSEIVAKIERDREDTKARTKEERQRNKELGLPDPREVKEMIYKFAIVDSHREQTGNFRVEPPALFRGRGEHPKMGTLKKRIMPEDITMNCSRDACPPRCTEPGRAWAEIVHNSEATWLAAWQDSVNGESKYVWLSAASSLKGKADREKFEVARRLRNHIDDIRDKYAKALRARDQTATALWLIDNLALRVGNEKDTEEEADTVGCCSLRVEHVTVGSEDGSPYIELDFLGKDSIRYHNRIGIEQVREHQRQNFPVVCNNLVEFRKGKKPSDDIFDQLTTAVLNKHLKTLVPNLKVTAKVFRTFNASITLVEQLSQLPDSAAKDMSEIQLTKFYNDCNFQVAKLCNHSRAKPKNFNEQMGKVTERIDQLEAQLKAEKKAMKENPENKEKHKKKIASLEQQIEVCKTKAQIKEKLSEVALSTSRINYLDPRITVSWCKKVGIPLTKIFNKSLIQKFTWAIEEADEDWEF